MAETGTVGGAALRALMARLQRLVPALELARVGASGIEQLGAAVIETLGAELGLTGGRVWVRHREQYTIWGAFGAAARLERGAAPRVVRGISVRADYPPVLACLQRGSAYFTAQDERLDRSLMAQLGARGFAAIAFGDDNEYLVSFDLAEEHDQGTVLLALGLLRHVIHGSMRRSQISDVLREARRIMASILPQSSPTFHGYDIVSTQDAAETVAGDFYDYIPISEKILGLAIADVSGHGLPAALQVRDIYMGLRMGMARDFKIVRTVERLNEIINLSTLTGRFVSMFYGELESDGTFIYVNAGHPPPFHLSRAGEVRLLSEGGVVLGPLPEARYTRGYLTMKRGDMLVLYTDGIVETNAPESRDELLLEYGVERLIGVARRSQGGSALEISAAIFRDLEEYCRGARAIDDRTLMVVVLPDR